RGWQGCATHGPCVGQIGGWQGISCATVGITTTNNNKNKTTIVWTGLNGDLIKWFISYLQNLLEHYVLEAKTLTNQL
ncbi:MAG: hypothetical protein ABI970_18365, partial [Chloroflexota bacterium]